MKLIALFFPALLLLSCSTPRLVPTAFNPATDDQPVAVIESDGLTVFLENIERRQDFMVYDLEIQNESGRAIVVDPNGFYYYADFQELPPVSNGLNGFQKQEMAEMLVDGRMQKALPEQQVERYYEDRIGDGKALSALFFIVGAGLVINDIANDVNDAGDGYWTWSDERRAIRRDALTGAGLLALDAASGVERQKRLNTEVDLHFLSDEFFGARQIRSGDSFRGKVYFTVSENYDFYRVVLPVSYTDFVFDFRKQKAADRQRMKYYDQHR